MSRESFIGADGFEHAVSPTYPLPVAIYSAAGGSDGYTPSISYLRTADSVTYAAGDVVGTTGTAVLTLTSAGPSAGQVWITGVDLELATNAIPAGMTSFRGHLYDTAPAQIADNAAWDLTGADVPFYLGYVDFGAPVDVGSVLYVQSDQINKKIKLSSVTASIWLELVTNGACLIPSATSIKARLQTVAI